MNDHHPIASAENPVFHFRLLSPMEVSYMIGESPTTPAKFNIDTKHDGLETVSPFKYWPFRVTMRCYDSRALTTLEIQNVTTIAMDCNSIATTTNGARLSR